MLFQAIDVLKNIDYQSQYVVETLLWLDSIALGAVVGLIIAAIIYLFGFTFNDLYNEDYFYLFIVVIIIVMTTNYTLLITPHAKLLTQPSYKHNLL